MLQQAFIDFGKRFASSKTFVYGVVMPLCIWGILTVLSSSILALSLILGFLFFAGLGWLTDKIQKKWLTNTSLALLYLWMTGLYVAIFTAMVYLPCCWIFSHKSTASLIGAGIGFCVGTVTAGLLIKTCIRIKKESSAE